MTKNLGEAGESFANERIRHSTQWHGYPLGYPRVGRLHAYTYLPSSLIDRQHSLERVIWSDERTDIDFRNDRSEEELLEEIERMIREYSPERALAMHPYEMLYEIDLIPGVQLVPFEERCYLLRRELITPANLLTVASQVWAVKGGCVIVGTPGGQDPLDLEVSFYVLPAYDNEWFVLARPWNELPGDFL